MLDFGKVTTGKGGHVEILFEDNSIAQVISEEYTQDEFQAKIRKKINDIGWEVKKGETVYLLMNSQGTARYMKPSDYNSWNAAEKKDWFHVEKPSIPPFIGSIIASIILSDVLGDLGLPDMLGGVMAHRLNEEFSGPSDEQLSEIGDISDDQRKEIASNENCKACASQMCPIRKASFSMEAFRESSEPATKS